MKYKEDYVNALNNSHNGAKKCIRNAQEEAFTIALEIHNIKEKVQIIKHVNRKHKDMKNYSLIILRTIFQINDHIENLKTVIDDCLEKNSAADVTLQCISDTVNQIVLFYEIGGLNTQIFKN